MAYIEYNPNPVSRRVGDCAVRAMSMALDMDWEAAYIALTINGLQMGDMPSSDSVSGALLRQHGFKRKALPDTCPSCYTAEDFCNDHPHGTYVLYFGGHVAAVVDGDIYDSWDSSGEIPQFYWYREGDE
jgi:prepilin-type processing-associated H-X9-DG protein